MLTKLDQSLKALWRNSLQIRLFNIFPLSDLTDKSLYFSISKNLSIVIELSKTCEHTKDVGKTELWIEEAP